MRALPACLAAAALLAGCGDDDGGAAPAASGSSMQLVDTSAKPPLVNSLERDAGSGEYLLTTNRGFFRIEPATDEVTRVRGTVGARGKEAPVGTFLELNLDPGGALVGSGHPDSKALPQYLGLLRSEDGGQTWTVVSRLGDADLHKIVYKHDRLYAWDAVLSALLISEDEGRTFEERFTPRGLIVDFDVDPANPDRIVAATEETLFRSEDGGETWRPRHYEDGARLTWPAPDRLYLADRGRDGEPLPPTAATGSPPSARSTASRPCSCRRRARRSTWR